MTETPLFAIITHLSHEGRGIAQIHGKTTFIDGALPGEEVSFLYSKRHRTYDEGQVVAIHTPSPDRVTPPCDHFSVCGGCSLQHLDPKKQVLLKQKTLLEQLQHIGGIEPKQIENPIISETTDYRRKARIGVRYVQKKQKLLIGFREKNPRFLADLNHCSILDSKIGQQFPLLRELIQQLKAFDHIPQIEVAIGDTECALVFRHMVPLHDFDLEKLSAFGQNQDIHIYLQPSDIESIHRLYPADGPEKLSYHLPDQNLELLFHPTDFIQVNSLVNQQMVNQAMTWLDINEHDHVLDLFCGLGNFSLPLARYAKQVIGVEVDIRMVQQAKDNAGHNALLNTEFYSADLTGPLGQNAWIKTPFNKVLLDPPRSGASEVIQQLPRVERILYVSCNPATLARDAKILAQRDYCLTRVGVIDMFPHTSHIEAMAIFEPVKSKGIRIKC